MRKQPTVPVPDVRDVKDSLTTMRRVYDVITPIFGGGVEKSTNDPIAYVRGTSIRGHLRFWWRATRSGQFTSLEELKYYEDLLWGAAATEYGGPSPISIQVRIDNSGEDVYPYKIEMDTKDNNLKPFPDGEIPAYFSFPLKPEQSEIFALQKKRMSADEIKLELVQPLRKGVRFELTIRFPAFFAEKMAVQPEIDAALWAWETFGGIGARTRRGFGALACFTVNNQAYPAPEADSFKQWLQEMFARHLYLDVDGPLGKFPELYPNTDYVRTFPRNHSNNRQNDSTLTQVWGKLAERLRTFRSTQNVKHWPEAASVRTLHSSDEINSPLAFPRAAFGLPIIFHFKGGVPADSILEGKAKDFTRLASPLLLRPIKCRNNQFVGLAMMLNGPSQHPDGIRLTKVDKEPLPHPDAELTTELTLLQAQSISMFVGNGRKYSDVLVAFLDYLEK